MDTRAGTSRWIVVVMFIITLVFGVIVAPASHASGGGRAKLIRLINRARDNRDLHLVRIDSSLSRDALRHTRRMIDRNAIYDPRNLTKILRDEPWDDIGASVVGCASSLFKLHKAWMHHAAHRVILMNPKIRRIGIGVIRDSSRNSCGRGWFWGTELFYG